MEVFKIYFSIQNGKTDMLILLEGYKVCAHMSTQQDPESSTFIHQS